MPELRPLVATDEGGSYELPPQETSIAVCVSVIDLGHQENKTFNNVSRQVLITWELPTQIMQDERPFVVSKFYTVSLNEKANMRHMLESWRGAAFTEEEIKQGFELKKLLGRWCNLSVIHKERNGKVRADISGIVALLKEQKAKLSKIKVFNDLVYLDFANFNYDVFQSLPEWIQKIMRESLEMKAMEDAPITVDDDDMDLVDAERNGGGPNSDDEIPF